MKTCLTILALLICGITNAQNDSVQTDKETNRGRIFLSNDQGDTWRRMDTGFPENGTVTSWAIAGTTVVAGTSEHGIYISEDGLKSWHRSNKGLPQDLQINALIVYKNLLIAGSYLQGAFASVDEGNSWQPFSRGLDKLSIRCFYTVGNKLLVGTDAGIYSYEDDASGMKLVNGAQINAFTSIGNNIFAATNLGALRSPDSGRTWVWSSRGGAMFELASSGSNLYSVTSSTSVSQSLDMGKYWIPLSTNFTPPTTFKITPASGLLLIHPWKKVFRSLRNNEPFRYDGLPANTSFTEVLETPYGILVAASYNGC